MEYTIKCADCGKKQVCSARTLRGLCENIRDKGWAINAKRTSYWCPDCAELHRHVGRRGARPFVQIKLDVDQI